MMFFGRAVKESAGNICSPAASSVTKEAAKVLDIPQSLSSDPPGANLHSLNCSAVQNANHSLFNDQKQKALLNAKDPN